MNDINSLIRKIVEFYATGSKELSIALDDFRQDVNAWKVAIELIDLPNTSMNVQFYGAEVLYFAISKKFNTISENSEYVNYIKDFLIRKISNSAHSIPHSVLNKLTSSLALFALKSMPDIWTDPLKELIIIWSNQLELLLTILSEIPLEFKRLNLPLDNRNRVRTILQHSTKEILQLVHNALEDIDSTGSLRNAAFECIESWLKLPDAKLLDFIPVFNIVFANINNDFATLARIIGTLKANDELQNYPQIIWQITQVIINKVCPLIQSELNTIFTERGAHSERMEDLIPVISTIVEFMREFAKVIVDNASKNIQHPPTIEVYSRLCQFFLRISTLPGIYSTQECLSDLPESWWISLTEELLQTEPGAEGKKQLKVESIPWFIQILEVAITKFSHTSDMDLLNKDALERFEAYRLERSDVSLNAIQIAPNETIALLSNNLHIALNNFDANRSEAILYLIKESSDFIKQSQLNYLLPAIMKCGTLEEWAITNINQSNLIRFARTFLQFINSIEHHLFNSDKAQQAIPVIVQIILSYLQLPELSKLAFESLVNFMKNRESVTKLNIDQIIQRSYNYFINSSQTKEIRLLAIRCVSMGLSFKESETIIESLNQILVPRFIQLENFIALQTANFVEQIMEEINFELSVLAQIVATLETPKQGSGNAISIQTNTEGPVKMILNKTLPLFNDLLSNHQPSNELVLRVCEVLKAGIQSLYTDISPLLENYLNFLDAIIELFSEAACDLAKKIYLTFHKETAVETPKLVNHLARWFSDHSISLTNQSINSHDERYEKLVDFGHFIIKKFWNCIIFATKFSEQSAYDVANFVQSFFIIIASVIEQSKNTSLIQETLGTLNFAIKCIKQEDNEVLTKSLKIVAERITTVVFICIQSETTLIPSLNLIADSLYNLAEKYPAETRNTIHNLPGGDTQLVFSMFSMHTVKNYRMRILQMHQVAASIQSSYGK